MFPTDLLSLGKSHLSRLNPVFTSHFHPQEPEGIFPNLHEPELRGQEAQSPGHKYLPVCLSLRAMGNPSLSWGGTPINTQTCFGSTLLPALAPSRELPQPLLPPSGGREELRRRTAGRNGLLGWFRRVSQAPAWPTAGPSASPGGGWSIDIWSLPLALWWLLPQPPVLLRALPSTHPHALESGQCPQGAQGPQRPQGFDGSQLRVAHPIGHQADDGDLQRERGVGVSGSAGPLAPPRAPGLRP